MLGPRIAPRLPAPGRSHRFLGSAAAASAHREGDISSAFVSLSRSAGGALPGRFRDAKAALVRGREDAVVRGWQRLLRRLREESEVVAARGQQEVPQVEFARLEEDCEGVRADVRRTGALVVRGVIPEEEARAYKEEVEEYVRRNPQTKAFPSHDPQVYELYWSRPQLRARTHPNLLQVQQRLMTAFWHVSDRAARISLRQPLSYADRLRIRQPGDAGFALGPHMDGGSVERWEVAGYGRGGVYDAIFRGDWEAYDPWDAAGRVRVRSKLYSGTGTCSLFRMWQGWLSMSASGPGEGTLLVNPRLQLATAYVLLRPFFRAMRTPSDPDFLEQGNWAFTHGAGLTSELHGASPGFAQEVSEELHPHLELATTMVHVPQVRPGDFVAWHCDAIHAVDKVHGGTGDSSVMYIPVCPVTDLNAEYLTRQRDCFRQGTPPPDFPGGEGEARHLGRASAEKIGDEGRRSLGLERLRAAADASVAEKEALRSANRILGFSG